MLDLKYTLTINGIDYKINTNFKIWLKFQEIVENMKEDEESFYKILDFFVNIGVDVGITQFDEVFNKVVEFFVGNDKNGSSTTSNPQNEKFFDFKKDESYLYAAFLQTYNIDLYDIEYLHWHKFKSLLQSLPDDCELTKIIGYRSADTSKMDKVQKQFYKKMKKLYSLEDNQVILTTKEYHNSIIDKINKRFEQMVKGVQ